MFGIDERMASLSADGSLIALIVVAVLLGLRHAGDPDHLAAVSGLIAGDEADGARRAGRLGLAWGAGHGTTVTLLGIPIVVLDTYLSEPLQVGTETLIGLLIMVLAVRLLARWRSAGTPAHPHSHSPAADVAVQRSWRGSYGIGLLHGVGGSAGIGVLLLAAIPDHVLGISALLLFAIFTAVSMGVASSLFGRLLAGRRERGRGGVLTPALGMFNFTFGAWYALGALGAVPYAF